MTNEYILWKFISTYHSNLYTLVCYQCEACSVGFGDRGKHPKSHLIERIQDRENTNHFPTSILLQLLSSGIHCCCPTRRLRIPGLETRKASLRTTMFLEPGMFPPRNFRFSAALLRPFIILKNRQTFRYMFVSACRNDRPTMNNYLFMFEKLVVFIRAYKRSRIPIIMENEWYKIMEDARRKYQNRSLKEENDETFFSSAKNGGCDFTRKQN